MAGRWKAKHPLIGDPAESAQGLTSLLRTDFRAQKGRVLLTGTKAPWASRRCGRQERAEHIRAGVSPGARVTSPCVLKGSMSSACHRRLAVVSCEGSRLVTTGGIWRLRQGPGRWNLGGPRCWPCACPLRATLLIDHRVITRREKLMTPAERASRV